MKKTDIPHYVDRALSHDENAIKALYEYTYADIYSMAYNLCRNKSDVDDILQEGYISAFSKLDTLAEKGSFVSWLKKIVINTWKDSLKSKAIIHETALYDLTDDGYEDQQAVESLQDIVEVSETNREIWELAQALPENQRVCMVLYYYEEMKIDEIAEALGIPEGSVKSRLYYGRQKLREGMEQRGIHSLGNLPGSTLTAPAAEAAASQATLAKILTALEIASDSGTAAAGFSTGAKLALSIAALLTAGGIIGGVAMRPQSRQSEPVASAATHTTVTTATATTTTTTITTTSTATTTVPTTTTTTAPTLYVAFDYQKTDGGVILTNYKGNEPDVVIPDMIDGMNVVAIGENAFKYSSILRSVTIPSTVRTIGSGAFRECRHLGSVSIGSGVTSIGNAAFLGCALQSVSIPPNVREIGVYAFAYCDSLTEVAIAEGTESIGYAAFRDCPNLRTATLPASVNDIGGDSFDGASPEFTITAPEGTYAYEYAAEEGFY